MKVTLLGPQRSPTLRNVVRSLDIDGQIATITAGWQEREPDDGELNDLLDSRGVNLSLYRRMREVQEHDPDFAAAERRLREVLGEVQELYCVRLNHALSAIESIRHAGREGTRRDEAVADAVESVRELDARHLERIDEIYREFYEGWPPHERPVLAVHRAEVEALLDATGALVITGGHVGVLISVLYLFNVAAAIRSPVIAWSAGAMALTERAVLFHDRAPQGTGDPEVYGRGVSVVRNIVALPHARARLLLDDVDRMAVFARRFAPAKCVLFEQGVRVDTDEEGTVPPGTRILGADGRVQVVARS